MVFGVPENLHLVKAERHLLIRMIGFLFFIYHRNPCANRIESRYRESILV